MDTLTHLISIPALPRAIVVGLFGGAGLALTTVYSRRGPLIFPVYAAILAALTILLARYQSVSYADKFLIALVGFSVSSAVLYVTVVIRADRARRSLVASGRLPASALTTHLPVGGHAWRIGVLLAIGVLVSAGVALVAT